jgi:poly(hydroxyalkanoate) depolymerase family esterase
MIRSTSIRAGLLAGTLAASLATLAGIVVLAAPAQAATLTQVTGFGSNPGALQMYAYRPDGLPAGAPLVVALHGCTQSAADYHGHAGWAKYADLWKFAVVYPQQTTANNSSSCFTWFQTGDTARGQGEALSVSQMVDYAVANYGVDPHRVFVTGLSAGGAMSAVMLATYPDVFAGGSIVAGLAYRCATDQSSASLCQYVATNKTPAQWGDLVRAANPGYTGPWPRVSIWYGTSDTTVIPANGTQLRDQWTNVWGLGQSSGGTTALPGGTTRDVYLDGAGKPAVTLYKVQGITHGTPVDPGSALDQCGTTGTYYLDSTCSAYYDAVSFGLATTGSSPSPSPSATATPSPTASPSPSPTASPTATPGPCFTASNYAQVQAGRAHQSLGQTYANGSNQAMGLWNLFVTHTLRLTGPNYYVLADGQC